MMTRSDTYAAVQTLVVLFNVVFVLVPRMRLFTADAAFKAGTIKARDEESLLRAAYPDYGGCRARTRGVLLGR